MIKGNSLIFSLILLGIVVWAGWLFFYKNKTPRVFFANGTVINVDVADTPDLLQKGLSKREILPDENGMIFVFPTIDYHEIWMKDMNFPLDLIWLDEQFKIVDITSGASVSSYPNTFKPIRPVGFVIEVNAGFVSKHNITIGDTIVFARK